MQETSFVQEVSELHAGICSALADPRRIMILYILAENRLSVSALAHEIGVSQPTASRQMKYLRDRDLVRPERNGASVEYRLTDRRLIDAMDILRSVLCDRISHRASLLDA